MADKNVSFKEFIETYKNETTTGLWRHSTQVVVDDKLTLDLYYYELSIYTEDNDGNDIIFVITHPGYAEEGLEKYIGFLHDMGYALAEKIRKPVRPAAEPEEFRDEIWDALLDSSGEVLAHEHPVILRRWLADNWGSVQEGSLVRAGATGKHMTIYEYVSGTL
jgi:hypothetical protein